jgi:hypothetical protein
MQSDPDISAPRREKKGDPSAWMIQRERLGLDYLPPPGREAVPVGDVIMGFCRKLETGTDYAVLREIQTHWEDLAGPGPAKHVWPARLERKTLTLCVENSVWLSEMARMESPRLLKRLHARVAGAAKLVKKIRLQVDAAMVREGIRHKES